MEVGAAYRRRVESMKRTNVLQPMWHRIADEIVMHVQMSLNPKEVTAIRRMRIAVVDMITDPITSMIRQELWP